MKTIQLSSCEVDLKDELTWGGFQKIEAATAAALKMQNASDKDKATISFNVDLVTEAKYVALEAVVIEIREVDPADSTKKVTKKFTRDWVDNLSIADGNTLFDAVNEVTDAAKKNR